MELNKLQIVQKKEREKKMKNGKARKKYERIECTLRLEGGKKNQNVKSRKQQLMDFDVFMYVRQYIIGFENVFELA